MSRALLVLALLAVHVLPCAFAVRASVDTDLEELEAVNASRAEEVDCTNPRDDAEFAQCMLAASKMAPAPEAVGSGVTNTLASVGKAVLGSTGLPTSIGDMSAKVGVPEVPTDTEGVARRVLNELGVSETKVVTGLLGVGFQQIGIPVDVLDHVGLKFEGQAKQALERALFRHVLQLRFHLRAYLDLLSPTSREAGDVNHVLNKILPKTVEDVQQIAKDSEMGSWKRLAREAVRSTVSIGVEVGSIAATAGVSVASSAATALATGNTPGGHAANAIYLPTGQRNNELTIEAVQQLLEDVQRRLARVLSSGSAAPELNLVRRALTFSEMDLKFLLEFAHQD